MPIGELSNEDKTNKILRGKERKNRYAKLNRGRWEDLYTLKVNCKGQRAVIKANKWINVYKI